jgi:transposase
LFEVLLRATSKSCPLCIQNHNVQKYGSKKQVFVDLPMDGKHVNIVIKRQRYRCGDCQKSFYEKISIMDTRRNMTTRLIKYIQAECPIRTFVSLSQESGVSDKTIRNIIKIVCKKETPADEKPASLV